MLITKSIEIDMGHRVTNHKSKCRNLHGHRYRIIVGVDDKVISQKDSSSEGMVIDFGDLKQIMMDVIDTQLDHGFMIWEGDPLVEFFQSQQQQGMKIVIVPFIPTAENIAQYLFTQLLKPLKNQNISLDRVQVFETPTSMAEYTLANYIIGGIDICRLEN